MMSRVRVVFVVVAVLFSVLLWPYLPASQSVPTIGSPIETESPSPPSFPERKDVSGALPIVLSELKINNQPVPTAAVQGELFRDMVFGVLSDGTLETRLSSALATWLRDTFHTFVYFSDVDVSRRSAPKFQRSNVTVVFLPPPPAFKFGNWKNLLIVKHFQSSEAQTLLSARREQQHPLWYVIVDDDTYLLAPAVHHILLGYSRMLRNDSSQSFYLGHTVIHCQRCRTASKRFPFAFGGNGIFMSRALVETLSTVASRCASVFQALPGDEQIGGCVHMFRLAKLIHMSVGTETFAMAFGDKKEVLLESPFPFSFHRIKFPDWHKDMRELELRHPGKVLSWKTIAEYFMVELASRYNRKELVFQEDINTTEVQKFLAARGLV